MSAAAALDDYISANTTPNDTGWLERTSYVATRGDGRRVEVDGVYRWVDPDDTSGLLLIHFLVEYLKALRNAYAEHPANYKDRLFGQIDFVVSDAVDRNGALVWENRFGITQAMEQAEYASLLASIARGYATAGDTKHATITLGYSLSAARSLDMTVGPRTGGVCSGQFYAGQKRARFQLASWYHSRGRGIEEAGIHTVLNQHLHAVRDMVNLYVNLHAVAELIPPEFGEPNQVLDRVRRRSIAGLYQLAFSEGHKGIAPTRPPNLAQFMRKRNRLRVKPSADHPDGNPLSFYWAHYGFDMRSGQPVDITEANNCHYHTHALEVFAGIVRTLERFRHLFDDTTDGWRLFEATDALLQGRGEPIGADQSTNAFYQFYRAEGDAYKRRRQGCPADALKLSPEAIAVYRQRFD